MASPSTLATMFKSRPSKVPTKGDWDRHQPIIKELYKDNTLKQVMAIMNTDYGFKATERMYKARLGTWNVPKYRKGGRNQSTSPGEGSQLTTTERDDDVAATNLVNSTRVPSNFEQGFPGPGSTHFRTDVQRLLAPPPTATNVESIIFHVRQHESHFPAKLAPAAVPVPHFTDLIRPAHHEMLWQKIYKGLTLLEQGIAPRAFVAFHGACELVERVLRSEPRLFLRTIFMVFGTPRWDKFEGVWFELMRFLTAMSLKHLNYHPISLALIELRKPNALQSSAEASMRSILALLEEHLGQVHPETFRTRRNLSVVLSRQANLEQSEAFMLETIALCEEHLPRSHVETLRCLRRLANQYMHHGRYEDAERLLVDTLTRAGHPPSSRTPHFTSDQVIGADLDVDTGPHTNTDTLVYATRDLTLIAMQQNDMEKCRFRLLEFAWICRKRLMVHVETLDEQERDQGQHSSAHADYVDEDVSVPTPLTMVAAEEIVEALVMKYDLHCDELASLLMSVSRTERAASTSAATSAATNADVAGAAFSPAVHVTGASGLQS